MQVPVQIVFREITPSVTAEMEIRKRIDKLERFCHDIVSCRVTVGLESKHKNNGNLFKVRVDVSVPGDVIVADNHPLNEDVYVAIRDAFDAMIPQLEKFVQRRRGEVKSHNTAPKDLQ
ncbi:MAG: HPF/RaiA family ribosome-associated protein [Pseudomonadota bacterium]